MTIWRMQAAAWADSTFATDAMIITPHFDDHGLTSDPQNLCNDLAAALATYYTGGARQIVVKAYDAKATPPVFPSGAKTLNPGAAPASSSVREVAVCLSYYAGENRPRRRGRLYIPCALTGISTNVARPTLTNRTKVGDLVPILAGLGGLDVDWVVYSRVENAAFKVTNWWVDDAWDVQRSRGLRPTTRTEGATSG